MTLVHKVFRADGTVLDFASVGGGLPLLLADGTPLSLTLTVL